VPTASRTWTFTANTEGLAEVGDSAVLPVNWDSTPQALEFGSATGAGTDFERARGALTAGNDWTALIPGVPAGATITNVQCDSYQYQRFNSAGLTSWRWRIRVVTTGGTLVHSGGELADQTIAGTGTDASKQSGTGTASQAVDSGSQSSSTLVALEVRVDRVAGSTGNDLDIDTIALTVTYSLGGDIAGDPILFSEISGPGGQYGPNAFVLEPPILGTAAQTILQGLTADAVLVTGSIVKQVNKLINGTSVAVTGSMLRQVGKSLTATSVAVTASMLKQVNKLLTATAVVVTATLATIKVKLLAMTATTVVVTASMVKQVNKALTATSVAVTASIVKQVNKLLTATSVVVTASIATIKVKLVTMTATTVAVTASMLKQVGKPLQASSVVVTGSIVKQVNKRLTATTVAVTATLTTIKVKLVTMTATAVAVTASMTRRVGKTLSATSVVTATLQTLSSAVTLFLQGMFGSRPRGRQGSGPHDSDYQSGPHGRIGSDPHDQEFD